MTKTPDQIREDIDVTRQQLGDTAEALGAKTDVKGRLKEAKARHNPLPVVVGIAVVVAGVLILRHTRS